MATTQVKVIKCWGDAYWHETRTGHLVPSRCPIGATTGKCINSLMYYERSEEYQQWLWQPVWMKIFFVRDRSGRSISYKYDRRFHILSWLRGSCAVYQAGERWIIGIGKIMTCLHSPWTLSNNLTRSRRQWQLSSRYYSKCQSSDHGRTCERYFNWVTCLV